MGINGMATGRPFGASRAPTVTIWRRVEHSVSGRARGNLLLQLVLHLYSVRDGERGRGQLLRLEVQLLERSVLLDGQAVARLERRVL